MTTNNNNINVANNVAQRNSQDLTKQWKKGELEDGEYYIKSNKGDIYIDICADGSFMFTNYRSIEEVLGEVPEYTIWKNYVYGYCEEHEYNLRLIEQLEPFTDPYFKGLTTKDISELAKKSIRLTTQHCEDNDEILKLKALLCQCEAELGLLEKKTPYIENIIKEIKEVLK